MYSFIKEDKSQEQTILTFIQANNHPPFGIVYKD